MKKLNNSFEGKVLKCPNCGEALRSTDLFCPSCGLEIRKRDESLSVKDFFLNIKSIDDENKKIELIKTYPVPNTYEDIYEFMLMAASNFDADIYASNKGEVNISNAWLAKIDLCYHKAKALFTKPQHLKPIEDLYNNIHNSINKKTKYKLLFIILGFVLIAAGLVLITLTPTDNFLPKDDNSLFYLLGSLGISSIVGGIVLLVFGFKKKKAKVENEIKEVNNN